MYIFSKNTVILLLSDIICDRLDTIKQQCNLRTDLFNKGQATSYKECLNMLSSWEDAPKYGIVSKRHILPRNLSSEKLLVSMIETICLRLNDLDDISDLHILGLKTAYVECLDIIQMWKDARQHNLDYNIEARYPIE